MSRPSPVHVARQTEPERIAVRRLCAGLRIAIAFNDAQGEPCHPKTRTHLAALERYGAGAEVGVDSIRDAADDLADALMPAYEKAVGFHARYETASALYYIAEVAVGWSVEAERSRVPDRAPAQRLSGALEMIAHLCTVNTYCGESDERAVADAMGAKVSRTDDGFDRDSLLAAIEAEIRRGERLVAMGRRNMAKEDAGGEEGSVAP